jgi:PII-like signaling protein
VNEDCLKLTAYFGERQRVGRRFYADVLLDLFGEHELATSILLRGLGGFGLRHHLRSDQSLSMSEDPSVVAIGVDSRERIEKVLERLLTVKRRGLLTLERARLLRDDITAVSLPTTLDEATKLTVHMGRQERVDGAPMYRAVCELLHQRGIAGASVLVGVDGTLHGHRQRAHFFDGNSQVPTMAIAVGSGERIAAVLPELGALLKRPLITVERIRVCKRDGHLLERPHALPAVDEHGLGIWQKISVHTSESTLYQGEPIHRALIRRLRQSSTTRGVTAVRGIWGFHGAHKPHGDRLFQIGRRVPVITVIVDSPDRISSSFDIVDELTREHGLVTSEMVPAVLSVRDDGEQGGLRLSGHDY